MKKDKGKDGKENDGKGKIKGEEGEERKEKERKEKES